MPFQSIAWPELDGVPCVTHFRHAPLDAGVLQERTTPARTAVSFEAIRGKVFERLSRVFLERTKRFARGTRFRREGRAPYLQLLHLLALSQQWSLNVDQAVAANPGLSGSITQIVEKGYLEELIRRDDELTAVLHFDAASRILSAEDAVHLLPPQHLLVQIPAGGWVPHY